MKQRFTKRTRLVSALLTLAMVFTFLPFSAFAADGIELKDTNNFPDKRFVDNIRQYDTKTDGYLSEDELNKVTEMNLGPNTIYGLSRNIENLKGIEYFKKLKILDCSYNKITELDTSSNSDLEHLTCNRNQLTQLIVSGNNALTSLSCGNNQLTALDVSSNLNLILLSCRNNQLRSLNLSHNDKLMSLDCDNNQLTFLDLSNNVKLSDNAKLYKDIQMITEKNNMHDFDTSMFFRWIFKSAFAILIVSNTWNIVMGVFDATQSVVNQSSGVIIGETSIHFDRLIPGLEFQLESMTIGSLLSLWFQTLVVGLTMNILSICIFLVTYGRMIEIYVVTALGPIPLATMGSSEWRSTGQNYLKSLLALGFQAFLIMIVVGIYAVLIRNISGAADIAGAIWGCMGYTVLLCFCLFKTGSISKSVFGAH